MPSYMSCVIIQSSERVCDLSLSMLVGLLCSM